MVLKICCVYENNVTTLSNVPLKIETILNHKNTWADFNKPAHVLFTQNNINIFVS